MGSNIGFKSSLTAFMAVSFSFIAAPSIAAETESGFIESTHVIVSRDLQRMKVYRGGKVIAESKVSSGKRGHTTPTGIFTILQKNRRHYSNLYNNAPMPNMQRLTWSGYALHGSGHVPNYPASHGCVRLPKGFASKLFKMTRYGGHVVISGGEVAPQPLWHSFLPIRQVEEKQIVAAIESDTVTDVPTTPVKEPKSELPLRIFITRNGIENLVLETQKLLNELGWNAGDEDGFMGQNTRAAIKRFQLISGLDQTGAVSKELLQRLYTVTGRGEIPTGKLYVRQKQRPLFEAPIVIKDAEKPLGAHLITLSSWEKNGMAARWSSVTLADKISEREAKRLGVEVSDEGQERVSVTETLDRIVMPREVRSRLEELLKPNSSITISDKGFSRETSRGKGTDFIVLTNPSI